MPPGRPELAEFTFHHDHVIGTSCDLCVVAPTEAEAEDADQAVLDEVERLRRVFSTYDPGSELSRLNRTSGPVPASAEMLEVLRAYEVWQARSGGAFNGQLGDLVRVWKEAEQVGREPDPTTVRRFVREISRPGWEVNETTRTVTRLTTQPLNLNAIAKGYIIRKAAETARERVPTVKGLLINLGGDVLVWGQTPTGRADWAIGLQDPLRPADNAPPLAGLRLTAAAVATSGGYQRFATINGTRYSHILDPRTGRPPDGVAAATVVAPDNMTANALATTLCVLPPADGLKLVATVPGAECLIVTPDGRQVRSPGLRTFEVVRATALPAAADDAKPKGDPWPADYQVKVAVDLPKIENAKRYRRPYVAVWVENADGKAVRTLAVWGNAPKYLKDLSDWWKIGKEDAALVKAVTRATRNPGKYDLVWDGKDDKGTALPQGTYTVRVEVHREHGKHVRQSGKIECKAEGAKVTLDKNEETGDTVVEYGKK